MRPRPDAAENLRPGRTPAGGQLASMRPRPDAAENDPGKMQAQGFDRLQ